MSKVRTTDWVGTVSTAVVRRPAGLATLASLGSIPFLAGDALKLILVGLVTWRLLPRTRALL
jgi:hypothetical protein